MKQMLCLVLTALLCIAPLSGCGPAGQDGGLERGQALYLALEDASLAAITQEPPQSITVVIDQGGSLREASIREPEQLQEATKLFTQISVGSENNMVPTDNYNTIRFTWKDGTQTQIHLNLDILEYQTDGKIFNYDLDNLTPFWQFVSALAE